MIYEFAISPELCTKWDDLRIFLETFGRGEGRLFSDIPRKRWIRLTRGAIKNSNNGQVMRKRLIAGIERLRRKAMHCRNTVPEIDSDQWIDHAFAAHNDRPFKAILSCDYKGDSDCVISTNEDFSDNNRWKIPLDLPVERSAREMVNAITPMFDCANEVILVDRNFNPDRLGFRMFLIELAKVLSGRKFSPAVNRVDYHLGDRVAKNHLERQCKSKLLQNIPSGMRINFIIWPWDDLHDRYVLTNIGGVKFGIGLDAYDNYGPKEVEINRISEETHNRWWIACKSKAITFSIP